MVRLITDGMNIAELTVDELVDICFKLQEYEELGTVKELKEAKKFTEFMKNATIN